MRRKGTKISKMIFSGRCRASDLGVIFFWLFGLLGLHRLWVDDRERNVHSCTNTGRFDLQGVENIAYF